jgi:nucleoside-diphosphate-sugar epimerase
MCINNKILDTHYLYYYNLKYNNINEILYKNKMRILITGGNGNIAKMIKNNLSDNYEIVNPSHKELDILNLNKVTNFLNDNEFDILVHTAILGGRRTKDETGEVTHKNLLMLENLLLFQDKFKMIINFDSAAIYDRTTDILNRKERDIFTIPTDYYGFSKYMIYQRSSQYNHFYNFRIFNIFHVNEEPDRFIKSCFLAKKNNTQVTIFQDKYFDFVYETDFIEIIKHYFDNVSNQIKLFKTINICYEEKYKLSEIAQLILKNTDNIKIIDSRLRNNYSGDNTLLKQLNIPLLGLEKNLVLYSNELDKQ